MPAHHGQHSRRRSVWSPTGRLARTAPLAALVALALGAAGLPGGPSRPGHGDHAWRATASTGALLAEGVTSARQLAGDPRLASAVRAVRAGTLATSTTVPTSTTVLTSHVARPGTVANGSPGGASGPSGTAVSATTTTTVPLISSGPSLTGGSPGPSKSGRAGTSTSTPPPKGLPAGSRALIAAITFEERQMVSLNAYAEARSYVGKARALLAVATHRYQAAVAAWRVTAATLRRDEVRQAMALARVELFQRALYELGVAEYTGQSAENGTGLLAQEAQVDVVQLGTVAAADTTAGLASAQHALALARTRTAIARVVERRAWLRSRTRWSKVLVDRAQLRLSRADVVLARTWATVAGTAPLDPLTALLRREGRLAPRHPDKVKRGPVVLVHGNLSGGDSSFAVFPEGMPLVPNLSSGVAPQDVVAVAATTTTVPATPATAGLAPAGSGPTASPALPGAGAGDVAGEGPGILGTSLLTAAQIEGWYTSTGARPNVTVPFGNLVSDYLEAARDTGVRGDVAFAQSIVETGYFSFPSFGQDPAKYNNFAGIGACDSCKHGWRFPSAMAGVLSQQLLLSSYASPVPVVGGRAPAGVQGCCRTWMGLSGVWASNPAYGFEILSVYNEMLGYALQSELAKVGLASVVPAAVAG